MPSKDAWITSTLFFLSTFAICVFLLVLASSNRIFNAVFACVSLIGLIIGIRGLRQYNKERK